MKGHRKACGMKMVLENVIKLMNMNKKEVKKGLVRTKEKHYRGQEKRKLLSLLLSLFSLPSSFSPHLALVFSPALQWQCDSECVCICLWVCDRWEGILLYVYAAASFSLSLSLSLSHTKAQTHVYIKYNPTPIHCTFITVWKQHLQLIKELQTKILTSLHTFAPTSR